VDPVAKTALARIESARTAVVLFIPTTGRRMSPEAYRRVVGRSCFVPGRSMRSRRLAVSHPNAPPSVTAIPYPPRSDGTADREPHHQLAVRRAHAALPVR